MVAALPLRLGAQAPFSLETLGTPFGSTSCSTDPAAINRCAPDGAGVITLTRTSGVTTVVGTASKLSAGPGVLKAASTLSITNAPWVEGGSSYFMAARTTFRDVLIFDPSLGISQMRLSFLLTGIRNIDPGTDASPIGGVSITANGTTYGGITQGTVSSPPTLCATCTLFTGTFTSNLIAVGTTGALTFDMLLSASTNIRQPTGLTAGQSWSGTASADFSNTAVLSGVRFYNAASEDISDRVAYSFASGYVVAPEPSSLVLTAAGMVGMLGWFRRRRRALQR